MGYARPDDAESLKQTILNEATEVGSYLGTQLEKAEVSVLREQGQSARLIHIACHGMSDRNDPLNSSIELADGIFTARDWLHLRLQADLVTLSACQTGINEIRPGDDLAGLMRAVLFAGASSLLTCLWSVETSTTRDWMLDFYSHVWGNTNSSSNKIDAFRSATVALQKKRKDPYYWAPFVLVGHFS